MKSKSLTVSEEYVYWIDVTENSIKRANKTVGHLLKNISIMRKNVGIGNIISLKLVHRNIQKGKYLSDFFFFGFKNYSGMWGSVQRFLYYSKQKELTFFNSTVLGLGFFLEVISLDFCDFEN